MTDYDYMILWCEQYTSKERTILCENFGQLISELADLIKCYDHPSIKVYELKDIYHEGHIIIK